MSEPQEQVSAPDDPSGTLDHQAFGRPKLTWAIRMALRMLPPAKRRRLAAMTALQVSLGLLDLLGIALIGLVAAVAVSGLGAGSIPGWAQGALAAVGLGNLTVSQLSVAIALMAVAVLVAKSIASAAMTRAIMRFLAAQQAELGISLTGAFLRRPLAQVQRWTTSEAVYALGNGTAAATVALLGAAIIIAAESFLFLVIGISLLVYDPVLTLAAGAFFGVVGVLLQRVVAARSARNAEAMKDASIDTFSAVSEALLTYRESTVLDRRDLYVDRYARVVRRYATASAGNAFLLEVPKYVLEIALYAGIVVLGVVQFLTRSWSEAAATMALFLAAGSRVIPSLLRLQGAAISIRNAAVMAQPTFYLYDQLGAPSQHASQAARTLQQAATAIHAAAASGYAGFEARLIVRDVRLQFADADRPTLDGITIDLRPGQSLALVGSTGAGKSTLADIILGVIEPDSGEVSISGLPPRRAIEQHAGAIAYVPQNVALIAASVRQNVALGLPDELIDDELVWEALRRAHLAHFLDGEREGLDTYVGERGFKLSGGQRQRLGIARALYTRPRLLVLDEATSALDAETELAITETLAELEGEVTTVTVAHRLATVRNADQVVFLQGGRIAAQGTFDEVRSSSPDFDRQASLLGL